MDPGSQPAQHWIAFGLAALLLVVQALLGRSRSVLARRLTALLFWAGGGAWMLGGLLWQRAA
ncbi:MAG: hypothetical protein GF330_09790, partial [Candidatus Eisenbacteria bacterium]|nr:hypothetical protein [Candidatus Eisenbacteria bacterium]